jgi:putative membrane protein
MMWNNNGWGWWVFGTLMMLVFWGGLAALVVYVVRGRGGSSRPTAEGPRASDARAILEERFARGEISKEEFDERRRVLEGKDT